MSSAEISTSIAGPFEGGSISIIIGSARTSGTAKDQWSGAWGSGQPRPPPAIGRFGIGMGGQGALRLACRQARVFPVVAGIAPAIEYQQLYHAGTPLDAMYDSKEQCRQDTAPMLIDHRAAPPHVFLCCDP